MTNYTIILNAKNFHGRLTADGYYSSSYEFSDRKDAMDFDSLDEATTAADEAYAYIKDQDLYLGLRSIYVGESTFDDDDEPIFNIVYEIEF